MPCLLCEYFQPIEPDDHRVARETGACQEYCGSYWNRTTAIQYLRRHPESRKLRGWCRLNPQPLERSYDDVCGQVSLVNLPDWLDANVTARPPGQDLVQWAASSIRVVRAGSWRGQRIAELENTNKMLKRGLEIARKRSAARLQKLQKLQAPKPKRPAKPKRPVEQSVITSVSHVPSNVPQWYFPPLNHGDTVASVATRAQTTGWVKGRIGGTREACPYPDFHLCRSSWLSGWEVGHQQWQQECREELAEREARDQATQAHDREQVRQILEQYAQLPEAAD